MMTPITTTIKTKHKTEQMEIVIGLLCMLNNIKLSKTDIKVLAYYVSYGMKSSTDELIINGKISRKGALANIKTKLFKLGFLVRTKELYKTYDLNIDKNYANAQVIKLLINVDNQ